MLAETPILTKRLNWVLGGGSCLAALALAVRVHQTGTMWFVFMVWNLVLALVPYCCAWLLHIRWRRERRVGFAFIALVIGWLVFFPNAPYVLTDVIHLGGDRLFWFDLPLVMTFAGTSWLAGLMSLALVDDILAEAVSRSFARGVVLTSCWLSGMGVYLGRFLRFNSWDVVGKPRALGSTLVERFLPPWEHLPQHTFALFFAVLVLGSYATFRLLRAAPAR
jgi:uncharacterized membrane protein